MGFFVSDPDGTCPYVEAALIQVQSPSDSYCTTDEPCEAGWGDCDSDDDCIGDLVCGQRDNFESLPGLTGLDVPTEDDPDGDDDYCYDPNASYEGGQGWTYAWYTADAEWNPVSIQGPYGNTWYFTDAEDYEISMTCYNDDSVSDIDGDTCSNYYDSNPDGCGNFDHEGFNATNSCCACGGGNYG